MNLKRLATVASVALIYCTAGSAVAGSRALADQGNNYQFDGQKWPDTTTQAGTTQILPFAIDVGTGPSTPSFVTESNGSIQFGNGDFINVALASESWVPAFAISNDRGRVDPSLIDPTLAPNFSADPDTAGLDTYRFLWNGVCPASNASCPNPFTFEATFVYLSPESFVLQFNYGSFGSPIGDNPLSGVTAGFSLGNNAESIVTDGVIDSAGPDFCFSNGVASAFTTIAACAAGTTTNPGGTIPEPDVRSLLLLGGLLIAASTALKSRRRARRASI